jgi:hypothetical protein
MLGNKQVILGDEEIVMSVDCFLSKSPVKNTSNVTSLQYYLLGVDTCVYEQMW